MTPENDVLEGDCVEVMAGFDAESIDAIVTDPPYDLTGHRWESLGPDVGRTIKRPRGGFMGKTWDGTGIAFRAETWAEALRVAKPGAHLLAFGGTRTYHRLAAAIEDAGWEIRDCLVWAYASGFPKSLNFPDGWGTALKPAWEPIVMARKPLRGTVAANREAHGTGALNINGTRIPTDELQHYDAESFAGMKSGTGGWNRDDGGIFDAGRRGGYLNGPPAGRWPANVILTDPIFDGDTPGVVGGGTTPHPSGPASGPTWEGPSGSPSRSPFNGTSRDPQFYGDSGTYSRFFLIPKADRADREPVLGGLEKQWFHQSGAITQEAQNDGIGLNRPKLRANVHPTVKPTELMRHLVRLVTPPGGLVLDPFLGSGTTALAAEMEGFRWIGIEKEPEYVAIARARLLGTQRGLGLSA